MTVGDMIILLTGYDREMEVVVENLAGETYELQPEDFQLEPIECECDGKNIPTNRLVILAY